VRSISCGSMVTISATLTERKAKLRKLRRRSGDGIQYVEHAEGDGGEIEMYQIAWKLRLEGMVSKRLTAPTSPGRASLVEQGAETEVGGLYADRGGGVVVPTRGRRAASAL
jgi:hypothetical protein